MGFIDTMRAEGHAVESICRVLREQGCEIAARTYRSWKRAGRVVAPRTVGDAHVVDAVREIAWTTRVDADGVLVHKLSPEGLYGRRKMTAYLRRTAMPEASVGSVDRAMRILGLSGVRRDKGVRTTGARGLERGTLTIVLSGHESIVIPFASHQTPGMLAVYSDLWPRVRAAHSDGVEGPEANGPAAGERVP